MIKKCEYKTCCNFFTLGRKTKFCSARCSLNDGKAAWKQRNPKKVKKSERARLNKKYKDSVEFREKCIERSSITYYNLTQEQRRQRSQNCRDRGGVAYAEYMREYARERAEKNPHFRAAGALRSRVRGAIKSSGGSKAHKTIRLVGCTIESLCQHLEAQFAEGMSWDNHGDWHIDHIIPCAAFDLTDESQQFKCFNYTNLQPLWASDNMSKGARIL